jgi:hypothetical protein
MHQLSTWEQSPTFDPYNPNQKIVEAYTPLPGGYGSFYWNRQPNTSVLGGALRGLNGGFSGLPLPAQVLIVGGLAAVIGFYGMKKIGPKVGLSGSRRRRRR